MPDDFDPAALEPFRSTEEDWRAQREFFARAVPTSADDPVLARPRAAGRVPGHHRRGRRAAVLDADARPSAAGQRAAAFAQVGLGIAAVLAWAYGRTRRGQVAV
jgi:hypothetical protein